MLELRDLRARGVEVQPVEIKGRAIARSFWGRRWCEHLESFSDYANRLPRGRTLRSQPLCLSPGHRDRRRRRDGRRPGAVPRRRAHPEAEAAGLESDPGRVRGADRIGPRAAAGPAVRPRHGGRHRSRHRSVSPAGRDQAGVRLPRLGHDVQARGGGALRRRRPVSTRARSCSSACAGSTRRSSSPPTWRCREARRRPTPWRTATSATSSASISTPGGGTRAERAEAASICRGHNVRVPPHGRADRPAARAMRVLGRRVRRAAPGLRGDGAPLGSRPGTARPAIPPAGGAAGATPGDRETRNTTTDGFLRRHGQVGRTALHAGIAIRQPEPRPSRVAAVGNAAGSANGVPRHAAAPPGVEGGAEHPLRGVMSLLGRAAEPGE